MKKKLFNTGINWKKIYSSKLWKVMRLSGFLFIICVFQVLAGRSYSQSTKLSLNLNQAKISQVLNEIENQSEFYFLYNHKLIDVDRKVDIDVKDKRIKDILTNIFAGEDVNCLVMDRQIVLSPKDVTKTVSIAKDRQPQEIVVTGKVTDEDGNTLPGVNIVIKETITGTISDMDGNFSIEVDDPEAVLVFTFIGMLTQEIKVGDQTEINITMALDIIGLEEVVAIGYGTMRKSDLTGSVQRVNAAQYETQQTTNMLEMLSGTVSGFNSNQGTSAAGGGSMLIRGTTSLKANNNPLIVVDGVIFNGNIGDINPSDIESIDILKDASSAAIFGARSASGILIITTKRGSTGDPTINFTAKMGVVGLTNIMRPFSPEEYMQARMDNQKQTYLDKPLHYFTNPNNLPQDISLEEWKNYDATPSDDPIDMWLNRLTLTGTEKKNYLADKIVDWYDEILQNGIRQDYDLSLSGGIANLRYYWSTGYTHNKGYILGDEYKTVRSRVNIDADISNFLKVKINAQYADRDQGFQKASLGAAITGSPYGQIYSDDGKMEWYTHETIVSGNPLIYYTYRDRFNKTQTLFATLSGELDLPFGFSYIISFVNRYSWNRNYLFDPLETPRGSENNGYGSRSNSSVSEWQVDNIIKWNKTFSNIHVFDVTLLFNAEKYQSWQDSQTNNQFSPSDALAFHAMAAGINPSLSSYDEYSTGNALMGRLNYSLKNKYLLTLTWRRDGYSAFGQANPYAIFPSAAFAWRISEEDFFNVNWIDYLKIRTSWGINGNRDIGMYDALARLSTVKYIYGNTLATGVYSSTMANNSLKWERTEAVNLGFDLSLFQNRLFTTVDLYTMTTHDLLIDRSLPSIIGYSDVSSNLGELENKGFEMTINSINMNIQNKFRWNSSLIFSFNKNKIKHLYGEMVDILDNKGNVIGQREADDWTNNWFIGESIDRIWEYERLGIWQLDEAEKAAVYGRRPGDIKLKDMNNDGILQPADDKGFQEYKKPKYRFGLRNDISFLKNFNLSIFLRADLGFFRQNRIDEGSSWIDRRNILYAPYWTPEKPSNEYAMLNTEKNAPYGVWKNSSFLRLQDVSLSYNIPKNLISKYKLQSLKVFLNLRNYYTITKWDHWDAESGSTPMPKYFSFGVNVNL